MSRVSICIPTYEMENATEFLRRNLSSILIQSFKDYEVVISDNSDNDEIWDLCQEFMDLMVISYYRNSQKGMAINSNNAIDNAKGELVKILFQDDYFYDETSLWTIVRHFTHWTQWLVTGCLHSTNGQLFNQHWPFYSESENTIGSPSVLTMRREIKERFDPQYKWVLDLDLYQRLFRKYGKPKVIDKVNVVIGLGSHQETYKLPTEIKLKEHQLLKEKYDTSFTS